MVRRRSVVDIIFEHISLKVGRYVDVDVGRSKMGLDSVDVRVDDDVADLAQGRRQAAVQAALPFLELRQEVWKLSCQSLLRR